MHNCKKYVYHILYKCDNTTCKNILHIYKICSDCIAWHVGANFMISTKWLTNYGKWIKENKEVKQWKN